MAYDIADDGTAGEGAHVEVESTRYNFRKFPICTQRVVDDSLLKALGVELDQVPQLRDTLRLSGRADRLLGAMVLQLTGWILRDSHEHELVSKEAEVGVDAPATWWDMLVEDHFPEWWKARWPVRHKRITRTVWARYEQQVRVCPHSDIAWPDERHLDFLTWRIKPKGEEPAEQGWTGPAAGPPCDEYMRCAPGLRRRHKLDLEGNPVDVEA